MCLIKYFYYYFYSREVDYFIKKDINDEWNKLNKKSGICDECYKYSHTLANYNKSYLCYRCFENNFYENI